MSLALILICFILIFIIFNDADKHPSEKFVSTTIVLSFIILAGTEFLSILKTFNFFGIFLFWLILVVGLLVYGYYSGRLRTDRFASFKTYIKYLNPPKAGLFSFP